jgi:hypothetical protein
MSVRPPMRLPISLLNLDELSASPPALSIWCMYSHCTQRWVLEKFLGPFSTSRGKNCSLPTSRTVPVYGFGALESMS